MSDISLFLLIDALQLSNTVVKEKLSAASEMLRGQGQTTGERFSVL